MPCCWRTRLASPKVCSGAYAQPCPSPLLNPRHPRPFHALPPSSGAVHRPWLSTSRTSQPPPCLPCPGLHQHTSPWQDAASGPATPWPGAPTPNTAAQPAPRRGAGIAWVKRVLKIRDCDGEKSSGVGVVEFPVALPSPISFRSSDKRTSKDWVERYP